MKKCDYCGKKDATFIIPNPNIGDEFVNWWDVCEGCKDAIKEAKERDLKMIISQTQPNKSEDKND